MSNYDLKYQLYCNSRAEEARDVSLASNLCKAIREIQVDDSIWNVTWNDCTFSVRPFLCSALSFMHVPNLFDLLCSYTVDSDEDFYNKLVTLKEKDYNGVFTSDENYVFDSILYQFNSQVPCIARYLVGLNNITIIKRLMVLIMKGFTYVYDEENGCINFFDEELCNTQAFSYYISFYWVLQKSKKLQFILSKEIKFVDFKNILSKTCPQHSIHFQYLSGKLTAKELYDKYTIVPDDGLPVSTKELYNLFSKDVNEYLDKSALSIITEACSCLTLSYGFYEFMRIMSCSYITMGYYTRNDEDCSKLRFEINDLASSNNDLVIENKDIKSNLRSVTKERNKLSSKVKTLTSKIDSFGKDTRVERLKEENEDLRKRLSEIEGSLCVKEEELAECKRTIRGQIKELKSLNARLDVQIDDEAEICSSCDDTQVVDIDTVCDFLKSKKLGVFGGFDAGAIVEKFKDYGIVVKHVINDMTFDAGDLDCAIVLTTNIQHKTVRKLKSQYDGCYVYVNGTNIENMLVCTYNKLIEEIL